MSICDLCQLSSPSGCTKLSNEVCLKDTLKLIRASATNGDIIQAVYPHYTFEIESLNGFVRCSYHGWYIRLPIVWWNAPYKVGDTDGKSN